MNDSPRTGFVVDSCIDVVREERKLGACAAGMAYAVDLISVTEAGDDEHLAACGIPAAECRLAVLGVTAYRVRHARGNLGHTLHDEVLSRRNIVRLTWCVGSE